jgi:hypothetical protein
MKEKIIYILGIIITIWIGYIAYKYLLEAPHGYSSFSLFVGVVALVTFGIRLKRTINGLFTPSTQDTYSYVVPLKKAAKILLKHEYSSFEKKINTAVNNKEFYLITEDGRKYCTEYIAENDYNKLNRRYLKMAKLKDIKIIKREGLSIEEIQTINNVGDSLEQYLFDYSQEKGFLVHIKKDELEEKIQQLIQPYKILISFDFLDNLEKKYKDNNTKYTIKHSSLSYSEEIWSEKEIAKFTEIATLLEKKGYIFFVAYHRSDCRWFGVVPKKSYQSLDNLVVIKVITVQELFTNYVGERYYTHEEKFQMFYEENKEKILQDDYEFIYKIAPSEIESNSLSCVGGAGISIDSDKYPHYDNEPMEHVLTLDLNDFECLKHRYPNARAISLYISDRMENEAYEPNTTETKVLILTQQDISNNLSTSFTPKKLDKKSLNVEPIAIPKEFLKNSILKYEEGSWQKILYDFIYNSNYVCGYPIWIQNEDREDGFIAQFDASLLDINLGGGLFSSGIMYVFDDDAYWQM